jgi:hypothetical protein
MTEADIASMRAGIEATDGIWAKTSPAAQARALAEFDARIAAARISGELPSNAPIPITAREVALAQIGEAFPAGENPMPPALVELLAKRLTQN